jgi:hypothetical protein
MFPGLADKVLEAVMSAIKLPGSVVHKMYDGATSVLKNKPTGNQNN